jgi:hypothetical protein
MCMIMNKFNNCSFVCRFNLSILFCLHCRRTFAFKKLLYKLLSGRVYLLMLCLFLLTVSPIYMLHFPKALNHDGWIQLAFIYTPSDSFYNTIMSSTKLQLNYLLFKDPKLYINIFSP